ncbi:LOW QUALITY PROTEIN: hypothetical protein OOU_Y34scaffold00308g51 [Pyricularia oryzae Y34]|uniref:S-adenosyl-L-methionine-dependent methyltransferase n=1 Tax=Pyricularia oryzae (strain Y34) TaxID=1143189 RepID=A0AA97P325_PYRO3|nr:LOW QUALITY PROTEIN: hypothetical protein OOU_Y34scaffold00308g51 [Pyricularia oryzae Y34]
MQQEDNRTVEDLFSNIDTSPNVVDIADDDDEDALEVDSCGMGNGLGGRGSSTQSLSSSLYEHVVENGRTYHKFKEGKYPLPNDEGQEYGPSSLICDAEDEWDFSVPFDFIHMRAVVTCFRSPRAVMESAMSSLAPGGWLQMRDPIMPFKFLTPPPEGCALARWNDLAMEASGRIGRRWDNAVHYAQWMRELGFADVVEIKEQLPLNPWAKGRRVKYLSLWLQHDMLQGIEAISMALFTRVLGWDVDDLKVFLEDVKRDMKDTSIHSYSEGVLVYGRKPLG